METDAHAFLEHTHAHTHARTQARTHRPLAASAVETAIDVFDEVPWPPLAASPADSSPVPGRPLITSLIESLVPSPTSPRLDADDHRLLSPRSPRSPDLYRRSHSSTSFRDASSLRLQPPATDDESDGEGAAAPVVGYARRTVRPGKNRNVSGKQSLNMPYSSSPAPRGSAQSLRSGAEVESIGMPSIERPRWSSASSSYSIASGFGALRRKSTFDSLRAQSARDSLRGPPTRDSPRDKGAPRPSPAKRHSVDHRPKTESLYSLDMEKENTMPARPASIDECPAQPTLPGQSSPEAPAATALGRLGRGGRGDRGDLGTHLIPSRRSSLRRSTTSDTSPGPDRLSGSRSLQELHVDADLIDGDDSTVRRIRELQAARDRRHQEWRSEARKSERSTKRYTIAGPKLPQRSNAYQTSRLSVTEVVVESPEVETSLHADYARGRPWAARDRRGDDQSGPSLGSSPPTASGASQRRGSPGGVAPECTARSLTGSTPHTNPSAHSKTVSDEVDAFLSAPRFTQRIRHPRTGRTIAFSEVGDPCGFVVLCCVGMGLTRHLTAFYDELATTLRLRLITPDRPGVGESSPVPDASCTPLNWVDDVAVICASLEITRFSLLAHSAGAVYALATALKMPQYVRGRIHLLAPWIPPSQMPKGAAIGPNSQPIANLPLTHKILSVLPAQLLKVANSRFLTATSASVDTKPARPGKWNKPVDTLDVSLGALDQDLPEDMGLSGSGAAVEPGLGLTGADGKNRTSRSRSSWAMSDSDSPRPADSTAGPPAVASRPWTPRLSAEARQAQYNQLLTHRIWALATSNANPAIDLVVCLERRRRIGFRYPEVTRSVVIHHGARDTRVPLDNVRWLQSVMKRCELRVLETEGHGLMASASVMATVLGEISREWEEWEKIAKGKEKKKKDEGYTISRAR